MRRPAALALAVAALVAGAAVARAAAAQAAPAASGVAANVDPNVDPTGTPEVVPLWPGRAPGAVGDDARDRPTLTVYRPFGRKPTDPPTAAVVIAPGGGYVFLATNHEGRQVANDLNALGLTAFVLRYRVGPRYRHPVPLGDAQRALRLVRARAAEFGVRPDQVGILGFSAGGHLAATAATRFDRGDAAGGGAAGGDAVERQPSRPDFVVLGYPVISFDAPYAHRGSGDNLLGPGADPRLVAELSADRNVTAATPPAFLVHTNADDGVPPENSIAFYQALRRARVPAELHVFERGEHGLGMGGQQPGYAEWPRLLAIWMRGRGLLPPAPR